MLCILKNTGRPIESIHYTDNSIAALILKDVDSKSNNILLIGHAISY